MLKLHEWSQEIWSKNVIFKCKNYVPHLLFHVQIVYFRHLNKALIISKIYLIQTNFCFIVCYDIDNVHIEVISIQNLINIDGRKLVEILVLILKEVIDRFICTIEFCHIWILFKHFFNRTLFLTTTNAMIYSSTFLRTTITNLLKKNAKFI